MMSMNWNYPTTIWFGDQRINEIQKACESLNISKPLIVTDPGILKTNIIEKINFSLANKANIFSEVQSNPTGNNVELGVSYFNSNSHDGVIAVGGGLLLQIYLFPNRFRGLQLLQLMEQEFFS